MNNLMNLISKNKSEAKYTTLISIDIKGAFNSLWWPSIVQTLSADGCPIELINSITDYLDNRNIEFNYGSLSIKHKIQKGCPQGSCLGPFLWSVIANKILNQAWDPATKLQAFADDFIFTITSDNRKDLELKAHQALHKFMDWAFNEKLQISEKNPSNSIWQKKRQY
ncbi:reverse transcriptase domain-containing protein [Caerostris extrusa]|uniref:Reverse transcriptase domain-containing protein n=1 Tax=Caerostris extrusa TaxID=172846 RepID=A0AAV4P163_CAEEX|nr:reverse transcriptase domain-containing protein [Caerostris extrusa]